jgi:hypothetical protein
MDKDSQETIILINQGDKGDGFFRFSSNHPPHRRRLEKVTGGDFTTKSDYSGCLCALVPIKFLSKTLSLAKPAAKRKMTDEQRTESILRGRELQKRLCAAREKQKVGVTPQSGGHVVKTQRLICDNC